MSINANQVKWTPIIPSDPAQNIPVTQTDPTLLMPGIWLWSGSAWVKALCDSAGHFQTDVLSLPTPVQVSQSDETLLKSTVTQASSIRQVYAKKKDGALQILAIGNATHAGVIIYTVPAGKTFFLTSATLGASMVASGWYAMTITNAGGGAQYYIFVGFCDGTKTTPASISFFIPLEIPATWIVEICSNAYGLTVRGAISGWEE